MFNFFKRKSKEADLPKDAKRSVASISIHYSYEWNEDVPEHERDTPGFESRSFCKELMKLNRIYTRADIETVSQRLGYSVWRDCGGEGCRHRWVKKILVEKEGEAFIMPKKIK
jgi:hypothetical protein